MTAAVRHFATCPHCGGAVPTQTPLSDWLRALPEPWSSRTVSNQNLDYIWHQYRDNWLITIEEKRFEGTVNFAQRDTHGVLVQLLHAGSGTEVITARDIRVRVEYRGHYVLRLEKTTPDDSAWLELNGQRATKAQFLELLRTGCLMPERQAA